MPLPTTTFTDVTEADFEELAALRIAAMRASLEQVGRFDPERARQRLRKSFYPEHTRFIVVEGQRIGFYTFHPADDGFHLDHFYIHPDWQSRGIGSHVMRHLLAQADAAQQPIHLGALRGSDSNHFYQRHGFTNTREDQWDIYYTRTARPRPSFVAPESIDCARVFLRPLSEADLPALLAILSDVEVVKHLGHAPWHSIADAEAWFARISRHQAAGSAVEFVIVEKQTGQCIGRCGLFDYDATDAQASVGYILGRPHWRQGFMREALTSLIDYAFGQMGIRRLKAEAEAPNTASSALLRRLAFTREGILRERWMDQGGPIDAELFALLNHEWRNTRTP
jgi:RimJ/RimL family protein N-acetyltransferase